MITTNEQILKDIKFPLGKDVENCDVEAHVVLKRHAGNYQTTEHERVSEVIELTIGYSGTSASSRRRDDWEYWVHTMPAMRHDARPELRTLEPWHLNTMHAGCCHQGTVSHVPVGRTNADGQTWEDLAAQETAKCPEHYRYGSAWLVKPLPQEIIDLVMSL